MLVLGAGIQAHTPTGVALTMLDPPTHVLPVLVCKGSTIKDSQKRSVVETCTMVPAVVTVTTVESKADILTPQVAPRLG